MPAEALIRLLEGVLRLGWYVASLEQQKASVDRLKRIQEANRKADEAEKLKFGPR